MSSPVDFVAHPPERYRRSGVPAQAGGCCCCCCCLHSLGGLIGAAVSLHLGGGPAYRTDAAVEEYDDGFDQPRSVVASTARPDESHGRFTANSLFWQSFLFLMFLAMVVGTISSQSLFGPAIIILMLMPLLQLASAAIALFALAVSSRTDRGYQLRCLGRLTLGTIVGSLLGLGVMWAALVMLDG